jgi:hypothetical protein
LIVIITVALGPVPAGGQVNARRVTRTPHAAFVSVARSLAAHDDAGLP